MSDRPTVRISDLISEKARGLECPSCGCFDFRVTRTAEQDGYIRRRRECRHCGHRVTTTERIIGRE